MSESSRPQSNGPVVARIILALIAGLPAIVGLGIVWLFAVAFAVVGFTFGDSERQFVQGVLAVCAMVTTPAFIIEALLLRFARWKRAPTASLILALIFAATVLVGTQMLLATLRPEDVNDRWTVIACSLITLLAGAAPPLEHWWRANAKSKSQPASD